MKTTGTKSFTVHPIEYAYSSSLYVFLFLYPFDISKAKGGLKILLQVGQYISSFFAVILLTGPIASHVQVCQISRGCNRFNDMTTNIKKNDLIDDKKRKLCLDIYFHRWLVTSRSRQAQSEDKTNYCHISAKVLKVHVYKLSLDDITSQIRVLWYVKVILEPFCDMQGPRWVHWTIQNTCQVQLLRNTFCIHETLSIGSIFRVTGPLCGEFTGHRWIPRTKVSEAELWCFLWSVPKQTVE